MTLRKTVIVTETAQQGYRAYDIGHTAVAKLDIISIK